jgi:hypothetical protein
VAECANVSGQLVSQLSCLVIWPGGHKSKSHWTLTLIIINNNNIQRGFDNASLWFGRHGSTTAVQPNNCCCHTTLCYTLCLLYSPLNRGVHSITWSRAGPNQWTVRPTRSMCKVYGRAGLTHSYLQLSGILGGSNWWNRNTLHENVYYFTTDDYAIQVKEVQTSAWITVKDAH